MERLPYETFLPKEWRIPVIISAPHVGTELPFAIKDKLDETLANQLPDTDWFVDELYDFASEMGAVLVKARYSRYVIDLNRPVDGPTLYTDNRRQTEAIPSTSFEGVPLYKDGYQVDEAERMRRIELYYRPYYDELHAHIERGLEEFGKILLWDAHSIKRLVRSIQAEPFPDLMLGDRDGHTAAPELVERALAELKASPYSVAYNTPFKGGQITRFHGHSVPGLYAMQLEMSQDIYMTDGFLDQQKAGLLKPVLKRTLLSLAEGMKML
ncbi:MAG: N-formylglutamate amidohydrolase [Chitinophagaceae bacterium]|nr:N-formylglutamate amidohydrolase [Oligoflexus sp.]